MTNTTVAEVECTDKLGRNTYLVQLLYEFGIPTEHLDVYKVAEMFVQTKKHPVIFGDDNNLTVQDFGRQMLDPRGVWLEIMLHGEQVGVLYLTDVVLGYDAMCHVAFWDSVASGRQPVVQKAMEWVFDRYQLRRLSAEVPIYQSGLLRFTRKLGFTHEGERRDAVRHLGHWKPSAMFGILRPELDKILYPEEQING